MAIDANGNYVPETQQIITAPPIPAPPTASTVYSAPNITQAVTAPVAPPNLSDPMGIYDYYVKGADVTNAQNQSIADQQALAKAKATAQARQLAIEQNPLESQQFIVGAQSRAGQLDAQQLSALADAAGVSQSAYLAARETASQKANILMDQRNELTRLIASNPGAGITYTDSYETAIEKVAKYQDEKIKEADKKEEKKLEEKNKQEIKDLAISLGISIKNDKGGTKSTENLKKEIAKKQIEIKNAPTKSQSSANSKKSIIDEGTRGMESFFENVKGDDGKVSPQDWSEAKSQWAKNGLSTASFNAIFGKWKNPNDKYK